MIILRWLIQMLLSIKKITGNTFDVLNTADDYAAVKEGTQEVAIPLKY